jgi:hypothetical protein
MFPGTVSWRWEAVKDGQRRAAYQRPESTCRLFTRTVPSADPMLCMGTLLFLDHHDGSSDGISKMLMQGSIVRRFYGLAVSQLTDKINLKDDL